MCQIPVGLPWIFFGQMSIQAFCPLKFFFLFLLLSCMSSLYVLDINQLSDTWLTTYQIHGFQIFFFYFIGYLVTLLIYSYAVQKLFNLMKSHLFSFDFTACALCVCMFRSLKMAVLLLCVCRPLDQSLLHLHPLSWMCLSPPASDGSNP